MTKRWVEDLLVRNFNEDTVPDLMCTNTVNVGWDGKMLLNLRTGEVGPPSLWRRKSGKAKCQMRYDCDFNQQLELGLGGGLSVFDVESLDDPKLQKAAGASVSRARDLPGLDLAHSRTQAILTAAHCYGCTAAQGSS